MGFIVAVIIVFLILIGSEFYFRKRGLHDEFSRKFVHITVGSFVAFWPFFLTFTEIRILSLAFLIVISVSKQLHIFKAIHSVQRPTWGEVIFALTVGLTTFATHSKWIYLAALLQMSLADGLAAVSGVQFGRRQRYHVFGHPKSVVGTLTFFVVSILILGFVSHYGALHLSPALIIELSVLAAFIENVAIRGLDNIAVPLVVAFVLVR